MVEEIQKVVAEDTVCPEVVIRTSEDGGPNTMFFACLFCDEAMALEFLQDIGLLRSKEQYNTCGEDMTWSVDETFRRISVAMSKEEWWDQVL